MSICPAFRNHFRSLWYQSLAPVFRDNRVDGICPEKSVPTALLLVSLPAKGSYSYACPMAQGLETLASLGRTVFRDNRIDGFFPENLCQQLCFLVCRFLSRELSPSYFPRLGPIVFEANHALMEVVPKNPVPQLCIFASLPPSGALPQAISKLFPRFPLRPRSCLSSFPSFLPSPFPSCLPSFLPSFLARPALLSRYPRGKVPQNIPKREPKHRRCFWEYNSFNTTKTPTHHRNTTKT